jgi:cobyrinic acid a,c-diamide synthase
VSQKHAFVIAGTQSGCGKTTISLGLMAAFRERGLRVQPYKIGPDFIDPGFHTQVAGNESRNLDGWMLGRDYNRALFQTLLDASDMAVVEGVMGVYDGYDGTGEAGSSAEMAKWLGLPVVLIVDARSMARSAAAVVYGFTHFDPALNIVGVVFNRIGGEGHLDYLKEAMRAALPGVQVLGGIPRDESVSIPERHLGLVTSDEICLDAKWRAETTRLMERHIDLELLLSLSEYQGPAEPAAEARSNQGKNQEERSSVLIAIARDAAFCFYYPDNLQLLRAAGAMVRFFSPIAGEAVPDGAAGLYLGGGYPELFADNLSGRHAFIESVRHAASEGMPIYAECGGLMTLSRFIETNEGARYPMVGILPFGTRMLQRRKALGYTEVVLRRSCLIGAPEMRLRGHEFHYSEIVESDPKEESREGQDLKLSYDIKNRSAGKVRREGYSTGSVLASYIHLHWGSNPEAAGTFVSHCRDFLKRKGK